MADESEPFEVETDASEVAIAATLNQNGRPVAFFSRMLHWVKAPIQWERSPSDSWGRTSLEALFNRQAFFSLRTDQKSVTFRFDQKHKGKIKNDKILRWRIELSCYSFDIVYKPGWDNIPPDALSRISCALPNDESLRQLHDAICHPGVTRLAHFIRVRNLPYFYCRHQTSCIHLSNLLRVQTAVLSAWTRPPCQSHAAVWKALSILKALFLATTKTNIFWPLLMNTLGSHMYFRVVTYQLRVSLRH